MVLSTRTAPGIARVRTGALVLMLAGLLGACASLAPEAPAPTRFAYQQAAQTPHTAAPRALPPQPRANITAGGRYKIGAPYQQGGVWYVPAEQPTYDEVGLASWYGDAFNGKKTANGEVFDMNAVSAAHATLPMPCIVEVTNLDNGRTMQVRLNDRGPYHPGRIIDLSHAGAEQLGYAVKGTTRVRVRYVGPAPLDGFAAPVTIAAGPLVSDFTKPAKSAPTYQIVPPAQSAKASPASTGQGSYVVQAGAFSSRNAADRVAARLASAGSATVKPMDRNGATLYRVLVGPWDDSDSAISARSRVVALGFNDARVSPGF
jgi:rare lipoprotein A